jgi:Transglutaminase-like superfamily
MMRSVARRLRTWTPADYGALAEACALAVVVELALRLVPLSTILSLQEGVGRGRDRATIDVSARARLARFAAAPYRALAWRGTCLRRSLVLGTLLRRRGVPARVCFGVDRRGAILAAHAWVAVDEVRIGDGDAAFHELARVRAWSA